MTGDSFSFALPLVRCNDKSGEASTLYEELRKPLLRYLLCLGMNAGEAEDVVQDAFLSLQRHLSSTRAHENIRSWLFRVAHNRARNLQASHFRRFSSPLDAAIDSVQVGDSPEESAIRKEKLRRLAAGIRALTAVERECLLLRSEGLRYREIGEVLGMATSTIADTVQRAIRKLAEKCDV